MQKHTHTLFPNQDTVCKSSFIIHLLLQAKIYQCILLIHDHTSCTKHPANSKQEAVWLRINLNFESFQPTWMATPTHTPLRTGSHHWHGHKHDWYIPDSSLNLITCVWSLSAIKNIEEISINATEEFQIWTSASCVEVTRIPGKVSVRSQNCFLPLRAGHSLRSALCKPRGRDDKDDKITTEHRAHEAVDISTRNNYWFHFTERELNTFSSWPSGFP